MAVTAFVESLFVNSRAMISLFVDKKAKIGNDLLIGQCPTKIGKLRRLTTFPHIFYSIKNAREINPYNYTSTFQNHFFPFNINLNRTQG